MDNYQEKYENLLYRYRNLERKYEDLEKENRKLSDDFDHAKFRIKHELEPRIQSEQRSYDNWVTDPDRGHEDCDEEEEE